MRNPIGVLGDNLAIAVVLIILAVVGTAEKVYTMGTVTCPIQEADGTMRPCELPAELVCLSVNDPQTNCAIVTPGQLIQNSLTKQLQPGAP